MHLLAYEYDKRLSKPLIWYCCFVPPGNTSPLQKSNFLIRDLSLLIMPKEVSPAPAPRSTLEPIPSPFVAPLAAPEATLPVSLGVRLSVSMAAKPDLLLFGKYSAAIWYESDIPLNAFTFNVREAVGGQARLTSIQTTSDMVSTIGRC